jgi:hypothetical protein
MERRHAAEITGSRLACCEWQTPLEVKFYLNITYGLFYAKFSRQEEAVKWGVGDRGLEAGGDEGDVVPCGNDFPPGRFANVERLRGNRVSTTR